MYDEETGLYYLRSRYYSSEWLRFVNADMLLQPNFNLFTYCTQNPTNRIDPDGASDVCQINWEMMSNRSLLSSFNLNMIAGDCLGDTSGINDSFGSWTATQEYDARWVNSGYNAPRIASGNTATPELLKEVATNAAKEYIENNPGSGAVYGTKGHTYVENRIEDQNWTNVKTEVSYLNGESVRYGMPGSVRLDIVLYNDANIPIYAIDLKFGITPLTQRRIDQINRHLPNEIPIVQVP